MTIYTLENQEYKGYKFQNDQKIKSVIFPELQLTTNQIFKGDYQ